MKIYLEWVNVHQLKNSLWIHPQNPLGQLHKRIPSIHHYVLCILYTKNKNFKGRAQKISGAKEIPPLESLKSSWLKLKIYWKWTNTHKTNFGSWKFPQDSLGQIKIVIIIGRKILYTVYCIQKTRGGYTSNRGVAARSAGGIFIFRGVFARSANSLKIFPDPQRNPKPT